MVRFHADLCIIESAFETDLLSTPSRDLFTCLCNCRFSNLLEASHGQEACIEA